MKETAIARLEQLLEENNAQTLRNQLRGIKTDFNNARRELITQLREAFENEWKEKLSGIEAQNENTDTEVKTEVPEKPKFTPPHDTLDDRFEELLKKADEVLHEFEKQKAAEAERLLTEKQKVLEKITALAHSVGTDGIGETFKQFNALQEEWKKLGNIADERYKEMQLNHSYQVDLFYHNVNLMKEMRELDSKINLEKKNIILEKMQQLLELDAIQEIEAHVKELQHNWKEIGPVTADQKEEINQRFRTLIDDIYAKIRGHYGERKQHLQENLQVKQTLIDKVAAILEEDLGTLKNLQEKTDESMSIQEECKKIGPSERNEEIWQSFRETCDRFFNIKQTFFKSLDQEREKNKLHKMALCEKAEELQYDTDWKRTSDLLVKLQKEWKAIGPAKPGEERKLWDRFRTACDKFFDAKKEHFSSRGQSEQENLAKKEELIARVEAFEFGPDRDENFQKLQDFSKEWKEIGFVPIKDKERLQKAFTTALDAKYEKLKLDREQRIAMKFKSRVENIIHSENGSQAVKTEQQAIKNRIEELQADIAQYENNLGFFTNIKSDNPLIKEVKEKIGKLKNEVSDLRTKLKMLSAVQKEAANSGNGSNAKEAEVREIAIQEAETEGAPAAENTETAAED